MPVKLVDNVKIYNTTTGTGAIVLGSPVPAYRGVEALTNGQVYSYSIHQGANFEYGRGTYLAAGQQLIRSPMASSTGGTALDLQPNAEVAFVALAEDIQNGPPTLDLFADRNTIANDSAGAPDPSSQTTTFTAIAANFSGAITWSLTDFDGTALIPVTDYLSSDTGASVTMTAAAFTTGRGATRGVIVTATPPAQSGAAARSWTVVGTIAGLSPSDAAATVAVADDLALGASSKVGNVATDLLLGAASKIGSVAVDLSLGATSKIAAVASDLLSGTSYIAAVATDLALGAASLIRQAVSSAAAAAASAAAAAASAASIGWLVRGPTGFALTDSAGYRWLNITLTDIKHAAIDLLKSRAAALEAYAAKLPLNNAQGPAVWALTDANNYNWLRITPTAIQHATIDAQSRNINAALRGAPDPTIADMRIIAERIGLHMSGESVSLGHGSTPLYSTTPSTYSDMFGNAGLVKASIVPDDINDISSSSDPDLVANRAALTPAYETIYGVDADDWTSHGESPMSGCAQMIVQLLKDEDGIDFTGAGMKFLLADDGRNGSSIITEDETLTGLTAQRVYASFSQAQALYGALGKSYAPAAQMLIVGTNDNASDATNYPVGNEKWFYTRAQTVQAQRQAKARALQLIGPAARLPLLIGQTATHTNASFYAPIPHVALDQLQLAVDHPEFILACIQYACEQGSVNNVHFSGAGSKLAGAYFGWHLKRLMFDGNRVEPLVPTFTAQGSQIVATFPVRLGHKIIGGLTVSDTTVLSNWGVAAVDSGGVAKTLSNPRVVSRDRIVWDAPAAPANTWKFRCGYTGNTTKGWTNIGEGRADSTLIFDPTYLRLPMYRWLPICEVPLT